jgi:hypothetical protein
MHQTKWVSLRLIFFSNHMQARAFAAYERRETGQLLPREELLQTIQQRFQGITQEQATAAVNFITQAYTATMTSGRNKAETIASTIREYTAQTFQGSQGIQAANSVSTAMTGFGNMAQALQPRMSQARPQATQPPAVAPTQPADTLASYLNEFNAQLADAGWEGIGVALLADGSMEATGPTPTWFNFLQEPQNVAFLEASGLWTPQAVMQFQGSIAQAFFEERGLYHASIASSDEHFQRHIAPLVPKVVASYPTGTDTVSNSGEVRQWNQEAAAKGSTQVLFQIPLKTSITSQYDTSEVTVVTNLLFDSAADILPTLLSLKSAGLLADSFNSQQAWEASMAAAGIPPSVDASISRHHGLANPNLQAPTVAQATPSGVGNTPHAQANGTYQPEPLGGMGDNPPTIESILSHQPQTTGELAQFLFMMSDAVEGDSSEASSVDGVEDLNGGTPSVPEALHDLAEAVQALEEASTPAATSAAALEFHARLFTAIVATMTQIQALENSTAMKIIRTSIATGLGHHGLCDQLKDILPTMPASAKVALQGVVSLIETTGQYLELTEGNLGEAMKAMMEGTGVPTIARTLQGLVRGMRGGGQQLAAEPIPVPASTQPMP